jgi:hypothetical protein
LVTGHRWIAGNDELFFACGHHLEADQIPLCEATRLLMNRCSGLLFARERLEKRVFTAGDADFVGRNIAKAQLALGDALLVAHGRYHWSAQERHRQLERLTQATPAPWLQNVCWQHAIGVDFKLRPERSNASRDELAARHASIASIGREVWLWIEVSRLAANFASPRAYAEWPHDKWPESAGLRNALVNFRALGWRPFGQARAGRHPRQRILNALTLLLWEPEALSSPALVRFLQRELQTPASTFPDLMRAYRVLWSRVN